MKDKFRKKLQLKNNDRDNFRGKTALQKINEFRKITFEKYVKFYLKCFFFQRQISCKITPVL